MASVCKVEGCGAAVDARGLCRVHYGKARRAGTLAQHAKTGHLPSAKERAGKFWARVDKSGECWLWTGRKDRSGYGLTKIGNRITKAHRAVFLIVGGEVPPRDVCVCHRCDMPGCVRPEHLFLGSVADNNADMVSKRRQNHGTRNANAKLTEERVAEMVRLRSETGASYSALAKRYGVTLNAVARVFQGKGWRYAAEAAEVR